MTQKTALPKTFNKIILTLENCLIPEAKLEETPSSQDGLDKETEINLRILGCELIQTAGLLLKLPQVSDEGRAVCNCLIDVIICVNCDMISSIRWLWLRPKYCSSGFSSPNHSSAIAWRRRRWAVYAWHQRLRKRRGEFATSSMFSIMWSKCALKSKWPNIALVLG